MPNIVRSATRGLFVLPVALAIGAGAIVAGPALAEPQDDTTIITATNHEQGTTTRSTRVAYRDLDLTAVRDQHRLSARISSAADAVCANQPDELWNKFQGVDYQHCYDNAVATALARIPGAAIAAVN